MDAEGTKERKSHRHKTGARRGLDPRERPSSLGLPKGTVHLTDLQSACTQTTFKGIHSKSWAVVTWGITLCPGATFRYKTRKAA